MGICSSCNGCWNGYSVKEVLGFEEIGEMAFVPRELG
jgi:hypothetical protein